MNPFPLRFYIISSFINFLTPFILGFVLLKNFRAKSNRLFSIFSFTVAYWSWFYSIWLLTEDKTLSEFYLRTCMIGVLFMPSLFIHFVTTFLKKPKSTKFYIFNYVLSILFALTVYTPLYAHTPTPHLVFYWLHPGPIFHFAITHFVLIVCYSFWLMYKELKNAKGVFHNQLMYVFVGTAIGYSGGSTNYFCWYRLPIPPFLNACVAVYVGFVTYAIVRYKLLDIHFVIRRSITNLILIAILTSVMLSSSIIESNTVRALAIIIISLLTVMFLPKLKIRTEDAVNHLFYKDKYKYQDELEDFIEKIVGILEKERLFNDIVSALVKNLRVDTVSIFIYDTRHRDYLLKTQIGLDRLGDNFRLHENGLTEWLKVHKTVFVKEEMEKTLPKEKFTPIHETMINLNASVCVPAMFRDDLVGFITLGEKNSGEMYSHIDTRILHRLGIILATTLELREKEARLREQQALGYIMTMAKELSHQLRNRLATTQTYFDLLPERQNDPAFREEFRKLAMNDINVLTHKLTEMMFFANLEKPRPKYSPLDIIITAALLLAQKRIKEKNIEIHKEIEKNLPQMFVDEEVITSTISNIIDNAAGAVAESGGRIVISANLLHELSNDMKQKSGQWIRIIIKDNGCGMSKDTLGKIFEPFFTTRSGGTEIMKMGFGLGLVISKMIVDAHGGSIIINSEKNKGTTVNIDLPVADKDLLEGDYLPPEGVFHGKP